MKVLFQFSVGSFIDVKILECTVQDDDALEVHCPIIIVVDVALKDSLQSIVNKNFMSPIAFKTLEDIQR